MSLSRMHFKAIAEGLRESNASNAQIMAMAQQVRKFNRNFDLNRFLDASGYKQPKTKKPRTFKAR